MNQSKRSRTGIRAAKGYLIPTTKQTNSFSNYSQAQQEILLECANLKNKDRFELFKKYFPCDVKADKKQIFVSPKMVEAICCAYKQGRSNVRKNFDNYLKKQGYVNSKIKSFKGLFYVKKEHILKLKDLISLKNKINTGTVVDLDDLKRDFPLSLDDLIMSHNNDQNKKSNNEIQKGKNKSQSKSKNKNKSKSKSKSKNKNKSKNKSKNKNNTKSTNGTSTLEKSMELDLKKKKVPFSQETPKKIVDLNNKTKSEFLNNKIINRKRNYTQDNIESIVLPKMGNEFKLWKTPQNYKIFQSDPFFHTEPEHTQIVENTENKKEEIFFYFSKFIQPEKKPEIILDPFSFESFNNVNNNLFIFN
ncbi:hypothetical protein M0812_06195 [Anaeramoeba flamelloides]|uniref:Uncharacterized protein n=1 Tax=Anaeramoeba flamelloides TaxID=1746091 RepID=A0AAV8ABZ9_9EUKA|nr:hypothetical protein M0812_06195 [Anaeramoeba flamelloides]